MSNPIGKVIEEFAKESPVAWQHMCNYQQAQGAWQVGVILITFATLSVALYKAAKSYRNRPSASMLAACYLLASALAINSIVSLNKGADSWARLMSPERDAARDVMKMKHL